MRLAVSCGKELVEAGKDFAVESTLSGKTYVHYLQKARRKGFEIRMCYLSLPSVEISIQRVRSRVAMGGHDIPKTDLRRRFPVGQRNFVEVYLPLADEAMLYIAEGYPLPMIGRWDRGELSVVKELEYGRFILTATGRDRSEE